MRLNKILMALLCLFVSIAPASAVTVPQTANVTVGDTISISAAWAGVNGGAINFGNLAANGLSTPFIGMETVTDASNVPIDLYIRASGAFTNGATSIGLNNLLYSDYGEPAPESVMSTVYNKVKSAWDISLPGSNATVPVNYKLTIPVGTLPGSYSTTIYHQAVPAGS